MGKRRRARVLALQVMYQHDAGPLPVEEIFAVFWESQDQQDPEVRHFTEELVRGAMERLEDLDRLVEEYSSHWPPGRMAMIDRNILRLAIFEILYRDDIPPKVSINEYVDIAKKFSTEESGAFVNGILDRTYREASVGAEGSGGSG
jgi:N utilization substance protein B